MTQFKNLVSVRLRQVTLTLRSEIVKCNMVDYYGSVSHTSGPSYCYAIPAPEYRDERQKYIYQPSAEDYPLNLSLNPGRSPLYSPPPPIPFSTQVEAPPCLPDGLAAGELGNVFIVSDLDCAIAQEEIVEAVEGENVIEDDAFTDEAESEEDECEIEFNFENARNLKLKTEFENLSVEVAKIRELLDSEAQKERIEAIAVVPKTEGEAEIEIKSEGEFDYVESSSSIGIKRSRNLSWPQMSTITSNQRKKEQNKMASKRFRERKKMELNRAKDEILELESRNVMLRKKMSTMVEETEHLKKILLQLRLIKITDLPSGKSSIVKIET